VGKHRRWLFMTTRARSIKHQPGSSPRGCALRCARRIHRRVAWQRAREIPARIALITSGRHVRFCRRPTTFGAHCLLTYRFNQSFKRWHSLFCATANESSLRYLHSAAARDLKCRAQLDNAYLCNHIHTLDSSAVIILTWK
jgi:hypothetical protein